MIRDPDFAYELCQYANNFSIDFIRRQYDAGANSVTILGDVFGTELISPQMFEKFGLPFIAQIVDVVKKEFHQDVWMHIHGNFKRPKTMPILDTLVNQIGVKALHLDEKYDASWIKENVAEKYKIPAAIAYHGPFMFNGPEEKIDMDVKEMISKCSPNYCYMAPSCEVPPDVPENHIKTWIQKTHEHSAEFYKGKK
jgi:uroporphyrinogen-III decarboxylase